MRKKQRKASNPCLILPAQNVHFWRERNLELAISRRQLLQTSAFAAMTPALATLHAISPAQAQSDPVLTWRHALSLFGDIKYPADFKRFDYVNPDAPKGGMVRQISIGTFDNFNLAISGVMG